MLEKKRAGGTPSARATPSIRFWLAWCIRKASTSAAATRLPLQHLLNRPRDLARSLHDHRAAIHLQRGFKCQAQVLGKAPSE